MDQVNEEQNIGNAVVERKTVRGFDAYEQRKARAQKFANFLIAVGLRVGVRYDLVLCEFEGVTFGIQESAERNAVETAMRDERERAAKIAEAMRPHGGRLWTDEQSACFEALTECAKNIREGISASQTDSE